MKPHELLIFLFSFLCFWVRIVCRQLSRSTSSLTIVFMAYLNIDINIHGPYSHVHTWLYAPFPIPHATYPPSPCKHIYACLISPTSSRIMNLLLNKSQTHHTHTQTQTLAHSTCTCHFLIMHSLSINFFYDRVIFSLSLFLSLLLCWGVDFGALTLYRASAESISELRLSSAWIVYSVQSSWRRSIYFISKYRSRNLK